MLSLILPALIPALLDLFKGGVQAAQQKWIGLTVEQQIQIDEANIKKLEALAKLDNPGGTPSQWVIDLRGAARYAAAGFSIVSGIGLGYFALFDPSISTEEMKAVLLPMSMDLIGIPFSFLFGDRLWGHIKRG